jgi:hypothetical protein
VDRVLAGAPAERIESGDVVGEPDRRAAIDIAIAGAAGGDVILIAGKGHEVTQEIGVKQADGTIVVERIPFDDVLVACEAMRRHAPRAAATINAAGDAAGEIAAKPGVATPAFSTDTRRDE